MGGEVNKSYGYSIAKLQIELLREEEEDDN